MSALDDRFGSGLWVSVVIATFNRQDLLRRLLEQLDAQTIDAKHYEVIAVDDGSKEDTREKLAGLVTKYSLRIERQANAGAAVARQRGVDSREWSHHRRGRRRHAGETRLPRAAPRRAHRRQHGGAGAPAPRREARRHAAVRALLRARARREGRGVRGGQGEGPRSRRLHGQRLVPAKAVPARPAASTRSSVRSRTRSSASASRRPARTSPSRTTRRASTAPTGPR